MTWPRRLGLVLAGTLAMALAACGDGGSKSPSNDAGKDTGMAKLDGATWDTGTGPIGRTDGALLPDGARAEGGASPTDGSSDSPAGSPDTGGGTAGDSAGPVADGSSTDVVEKDGGGKPNKDAAADAPADAPFSVDANRVDTRVDVRADGELGCGEADEACCGGPGNRTCTAAGTVCNGNSADARCVQCGGPGQPCCANSACGAGATCNTSGSGLGICEACGTAGGACCPDDSCAAGGCCVREGGSNRCLAVGTSCPGEGTCRASTCVGTGDAGTCGGLGDRCCRATGGGQGNEFCTGANLACVDETTGSVCRACGAKNQVCCANRRCQNNLNCEGGGNDATCK